MSASQIADMRVIALSGGVGGARLVDGLATCLAPQNLLVIANTGDDFEHLGLPICPDLDTVMYTLAGVANPDTGWGRREESWSCMASLAELGGDSWFNLGDRDLATHLRRAEMIRQGKSLSVATSELCGRLGVNQLLVPMSDGAVRTMVETPAGELPFQHYFVRERCEPRVSGFRFSGCEMAAPAPAIEEFCAVAAVDAVIICPSNPFVSVDPILSVAGMRELLLSLDCPWAAVSPIIAGRAVKGPAAKMLGELGIDVSAASIADHYRGLVQLFAIDTADAALVADIEDRGMSVLLTPTLIAEPGARRRLATELLRAIGAAA
jgi:LPPG:FO 2-phospho-L-lactate transferase